MRRDTASVVPPAGKPHSTRVVTIASAAAEAKSGQPSVVTLPAATNWRLFIIVGSSFERLEWRSARRHAQRAVEADHLAVERTVLDDRRGKVGEFLGLAEALGERDARGQRGLHFFGQLLQERRQEQARRDRRDPDAVLG